MKTEKEGPQKHYTMTPSVVVFRLVEHPVSLLILQYVLIRRRIYDQFRVKDMARLLRKDERTIRAALKPLRKLELLVLKGKPGTQYYEFNESKYAAYMLINPFASGDAPSQKMGVVPSQKMQGEGTAENEGRPLSKSEGVKSKGIEERESKETERGLSSVGSQPPSTAAAAPLPSRDLAEEFERMFEGTTLPSTPSGSPSGESQPAEGGVPVGMPSTSVAYSSPSTTIQGASGNSNDGGQNKMDNGLVSVSAPIIQRSVNGKTNTGAPESNTGHPGASAKRAAGTSAKAGGVRGALPKAVVEHADYVLRQMKKSSPLTKESIEVVERELWKRLSEYKWSHYQTWSDPRQEVNMLKEKLVSKFGRYE